MTRRLSIAVGAGALALLLASPAAAQTTQQPTPQQQQLAQAVAPLVETIMSFDWKTQRVVMALPPGINSRGPYSIHVQILGDGASLYDADVKFAEDAPVSAAYPRLPPGARILRLSADATWPAQIAAITKTMDEAKTKFAENKREARFDFKMNFTIDPAWRGSDCGPGANVPVPLVFVEGSQQGDLRRVDVGPVAGIMAGAITNACKEQTTPT